MPDNNKKTRKDYYHLSGTGSKPLYPRLQGPGHNWPYYPGQHIIACHYTKPYSGQDAEHETHHVHEGTALMGKVNIVFEENLRSGRSNQTTKRTFNNYQEKQKAEKRRKRKPT